VGFVVDNSAFVGVSSERFLCKFVIPSTALQSSSLIQGCYNKPISGINDSGLGSTSAQSVNKNKYSSDGFQWSNVHTNFRINC
jgi:hypothetical protein